jgi:hypothetical protein
MVQVLPCWQSFSVESQSALLCTWKRVTKCLPVSIFINRLTYHWNFFLHFMVNQYPFLVFFATFLFVVARAADSTFAGDLSSISIVPQSGSFLSSTNFQYQGEALRDVIRSRSSYSLSSDCHWDYRNGATIYFNYSSPSQPSCVWRQHSEEIQISRVHE